jgi:hypothetical protein
MNRRNTPARTLGALALVAACAAAQAPSNNSCSSPLTVFAGVNPQSPNGSSGQFFTNFGATNSSTTAFGLECATTNFNKDVWFEFTPTITGNFVIKTCTPSGFSAGTLTTSVIAVYDAADCPSGGTALACNDDSSNCGTNSDLSAIGVNLWDGHTYLIRVGSESVTAAGTFYLTITAPATAANDSCSGAIALVEGANSGSFNGSNSGVFSYGCPDFSNDHTDVWFKIDATFGDVLTGIDLAIFCTSTVQYTAVYQASCPSLLGSYTVLDCGHQTVSFRPFLIGTYYVRVGRMFSVEPGLGFTVTVTKTPVPNNDDCTGGYLTYGGTYPYYAAQAASYSNDGALETDFGPSPPSCVAETNSDVWYDYVATVSGRVLVTTETPAGATPGTLNDSVVAVFSTCPAGGVSSLIACDDDSGAGLTARLTFDAVQGTHYKVMVAGWNLGSNNEGSYWLTIAPQFRLAMSAPGGPGTIQINVDDGGPNHAFFTCLTINQGNYPYGPFFGIDPTFFEIVLQLTSNAEPFIGFLNSAGNYQFGPAPSIAGLTLYGVTLQFDSVANIAGVTTWTNFTVP